MVFEKNGYQTTKNEDFRVKRTPHKNWGYVHLQNSHKLKIDFLGTEAPSFKPITY